MKPFPYDILRFKVSDPFITLNKMVKKNSKLATNKEFVGILSEDLCYMLMILTDLISVG